MSSSPGDLTAAIAVWDGLDEDARLALARSVARRRVREWKRELAGITSVGAGYRTRGGTNHPRREVCLRFIVTRKRRRLEAGAVPERVLACVEVDGRRRRCAIPTDVDMIRGGDNNAGLDHGVVARAPNAASGGTRGCVCAVVKSAGPGDARYLLSCNHVIALHVAGSCSARTSTAVYRCSAPGVPAHRIAHLWHAKDLVPAVGYGVDAALARIDDGALVTEQVQGATLTRVAADGELPPPGSRICSARRRIPTRFVGEQFDLTVRFRCGSDVRLKHVFLMQAATRDGDSGAPLVGLDGTLFGMHFYLTGSPQYALSLPAAELFRTGMWPVDMRLAT